jgi:hypothetical protein
MESPISFFSQCPGGVQSMLYDLENGFIADALISDCGKGEDALCRENIKNAP